MVVLFIGRALMLIQWYDNLHNRLSVNGVQKIIILIE